MVAVWSVAEPCLGIVAACLPTMGPFIAKVILQFAKLRNGLRYSSTMKKRTGSKSTRAAASNDDAYSDVQPLQDFQACARMDTYTTSSERSRDSALGQVIQVPPNAIDVNTTTIWTGK